MSVSVIIRSKAEMSLCCESWLWYLKEGAFEVIETLLDLVFWLAKGENYLFLLSETSLDVFV